ncbi:hypothetical protein FRB91_009174 [Serendipita sp. 411]|nr:hypothetical protein FRC18_007826 [Serendipita sp. 400]KAG8807150.1 hypothetical protein FRC19_006836 [Serendipita sp. 401]KAG8861263.1 hypothetical protein FRB91_009174 [Serendipita sp. 411]KAG9021884.1 hypothetical protein FS842_006405 [Serendipita sp. 407]
MSDLEDLQRDYQPLFSVFEPLETLDFDSVLSYDGNISLPLTLRNFPVLAYRQGLDGLYESVRALSFDSPDLHFQLGTFRALIDMRLQQLHQFIVDCYQRQNIQPSVINAPDLSHLLSQPWSLAPVYSTLDINNAHLGPFSMPIVDSPSMPSGDSIRPPHQLAPNDPTSNACANTTTDIPTSSLDPLLISEFTSTLLNRLNDSFTFYSMGTPSSIPIPPPSSHDYPIY